jgi:hypothetical protein
MLIVVVASLLVAWGVVSLVTVGLCMSAARGDRSLVRSARRRSGRSGQGSRPALGRIA